MKRNYTQEDYKSGKLNITANYVPNVLPGKSTFVLYTYTISYLYDITCVIAIHLQSYAAYFDQRQAPVTMIENKHTYYKFHNPHPSFYI